MVESGTCITCLWQGFPTNVAKKVENHACHPSFVHFFMDFSRISSFRMLGISLICSFHHMGAQGEAALHVAGEFDHIGLGGKVVEHVHDDGFLRAGLHG